MWYVEVGPTTFLQKIVQFFVYFFFTSVVPDSHPELDPFFFRYCPVIVDIYSIKQGVGINSRKVVIPPLNRLLLVYCLAIVNINFPKDPEDLFLKLWRKGFGFTRMFS